MYYMYMYMYTDASSLCMLVLTLGAPGTHLWIGLWYLECEGQFLMIKVIVQGDHSAMHPTLL